MAARTLTIDEAAAMLKCGVDTAVECIKTRGLPAAKPRHGV